ncbi:hypothetical protein B566_EDAN014491 [Ephemera danica]|nr:hypothetical protein B566_EDAN014491 [Ephemera danica]
MNSNSMSSKDKGCGPGDGEASSATISSPVIEQLDVSASQHYSPESDKMKRAAAKKLIERYFYQLTDGCGDPKCDNEHCASSGKVKNLSPNQAAALAIQLFSQEARLCDAQRSKVARTTQEESRTENGKTITGGAQDASKLSVTCHLQQLEMGSSTAANKAAAQTSSKQAEKQIPYLTEERLLTILETCKAGSSHSLLIRTIGSIYSSAESLVRSFIKKESSSPLDAILSKAPLDLKNLKKEDMRSLEGDLDKDEDSQELAEQGECSENKKVTRSPDDITVDLESLRRAYKALFAVPGSIFESALINALLTLSGSIELDLRLFGAVSKDPNFLNIFVIVLELPALGTAEYLEMALPALCKAAAHLPLTMQAQLARILAKHCQSRLKGLLEAMHQLITLKVISGQFSREYIVNDEESITAATRLMKILFYASMLAGELDPPELRSELDGSFHASNCPEDDDFPLGGGAGGDKEARPFHQDPLGTELQINVLDARKPLIPFSEFYNEPLSEAVEMDKDFAYYKSEPDHKKFSFMNYSFILTPFTKSLGLYYDNRIRMYSERRISILQSVVGQPTNPYLRLKVKRDHLIDDALVELEVVAMENPKDLKKQLVVEFEGEQGIDEGGVSKEFFQLIVEEIFNPDYGMFTFQQETQTVWFNPTSFESDAQFTLIGIVLGLAIYNNVILDVHFPMVVYSKLMGKQGTFHDLEDWNSTMYLSLKDMLEYEGDEMEDTYLQTFRVCYQDVFGNTFNHDLKPGGDQICVNLTNRKEFVDLYADFLLNKSVEKQFRAFRRGFQMVTDESPLHLLFRPEEVEQLVCGSKNFDFNELEEATEYDGGYSAESQLIRYFWDIVHKMPLESKRKLLQFATGSDRVPVGGLSKLKLIIARNGPDSDRLPTAHTCFNVLLLPEYESREKLNDRLMKAINYSKGFGML